MIHPTFHEQMRVSDNLQNDGPTAFYVSTRERLLFFSTWKKCRAYMIYMKSEGEKST